MFGELAHYFPILFWKLLKYELGSPEWKASLIQVELFCWGMKNWNTIQRKYIKKCTGHLSQRTKKNPSRTHITYHHRIFVMQLLFYQELLKNNDSCSTQHYEPFWIKRCRKLLIIFSLAISGKIQRFLGHHSLMARPQDTVSVFWKRDLPMFLVS